MNCKVVEPDKLDIDLDKIKKGGVRDVEMFNRLSKKDSEDMKLGPFIVNLEDADLVSLMYGPGEMEAFALYEHGHDLWWRHREGAMTHDFRVAAFGDMQEFVAFIDDSINYWECVLRTEARISGFKGKQMRLKVSEVKGFVKKHNE